MASWRSALRVIRFVLFLVAALTGIGWLNLLARPAAREPIGRG